MHYFFAVIALGFIGIITTGCKSFDERYLKAHSGAVWCSEPYLPLDYPDKKKLEANEMFKKQVSLSHKGYMYAMAATFTLQGDKNSIFNKNGLFNFDFNIPHLKRLKEIEELNVLDEAGMERSGFGATTFILYKEDERVTPEAVVIAFQGSNEKEDWFLSNLSPFPIQLDDARLYAKLVHQNKEVRNLREKGVKVVATGFSLGGALAAHVKKHREMKYEEGTSNDNSTMLCSNKESKEKNGKYLPVCDIIDEVWAFNPSPRVRAIIFDRSAVPSSADKNIYLLAKKNELLNFLPFRIWRENVLGATSGNTSTNFNLIKTNLIYAHFRWVLTREILQYADLYEYHYEPRYRLDRKHKSHPMKILESQPISKIACNQERIDRKWSKHLTGHVD